MLRRFACAAALALLTLAACGHDDHDHGPAPVDGGVDARADGGTNTSDAGATDPARDASAPSGEALAKELLGADLVPSLDELEDDLYPPGDELPNDLEFPAP